MKSNIYIFSAALFFTNGGISFHFEMPHTGTKLRSKVNLEGQKLETEEQLISRLDVEIMADVGVPLDQLINPAKVVNLERDIARLRSELSESITETDKLAIQFKIKAKTNNLLIEKKSVMRSWLKRLFIGQAIIAGAVSLAMANDAVPGYAVPLPVRVLGFWMWWLFIIPSLRYCTIH